MKKTLFAICAVSMAALLQAGTLTDFSDGAGRAKIRTYNLAKPVAMSYINDDSIAPAPAKVLKVVLPEPKADGGSRLDINFALKAGEITADQKLAFDVKVSDPAAVSWTTFYLFGSKRATPFLLSPSGIWRNVNANEWKHFEVSIAAFKPYKGQEIALNDLKELCISFFCNNAVVLEFANIKLIEK